MEMNHPQLQKHVREIEGVRLRIAKGDMQALSELQSIGEALIALADELEVNEPHVVIARDDQPRS